MLRFHENRHAAKANLDPMMHQGSVKKHLDSSDNDGAVACGVKAFSTMTTQMCGMVHAIHKNAVAPRIEHAGPFIALPGGTARQLGGFIIGSVWSKMLLSCTQCKISTGRALDLAPIAASNR